MRGKSGSCWGSSVIECGFSSPELQLLSAVLSDPMGEGVKGETSSSDARGNRGLTVHIAADEDGRTPVQGFISGSFSRENLNLALSLELLDREALRQTQENSTRHGSFQRSG